MTIKVRKSEKKGNMKKAVITLASLGTAAGMLAGGFGTTASASASTPPPLNFITLWDYNAGMTVLNSGNSVSAVLNGLVNMPLAMWLEDNGKYYPMIASSWKQSGNTLTIHIRPNAKWSNGQPVTAKDVALSIELGGDVFGDSYGPYLKSVKVVNNTTVQAVEGKPYPYFAWAILVNTVIIPYSEYGSLVPKNLFSLYQQSTGSGKAAVNAGNELSSLDKKLVAYKKNYFLGEGPYKIQSSTTSQAELVKNPYYFAASNVHVPVIEAYNVPGNTQAWGLYAANKTDLASDNGPWTIIHEWERTKGHTIITPNMFANTALFFNTSVYPFNMVQVRQAISYVIDRKTIANVAEPLVGFQVPYPVAPFFGLTMKQFLNKSAYKQLNPYNVNLAKATQLLESVGFKKTSSGWTMPNGKPFSTSVYSVNGYSDWNIATTEIASELNKFGIQTQNRQENGSTYFTQAPLTTNGYPMFLDWGANSPDPYFDMTNFLGIYGYNQTANGYSHTKGTMTLPTSIKLQNGKTVNIIKEGFNLLNQNKAQRMQSVADIAEASNQAMLADDLWDYGWQIFLSTQHYVGWPSGTDPRWTVANNSAQEQPLALFVTEGWIRPAQ